ncbi:MAG TPA: hypothetical protein VF447_00135 [Terriglobales bacterium]
MSERTLFNELVDGLDALRREREAHGLSRKIKITRLRFRKMRKPYGRRLLIPVRRRLRTPMFVRRYGLIARLR